MNDDLAKSEAKVFVNALKDAKKKNLIEDEEIVRILSIRSKLHLKAICSHYKEMTGNFLDEVTKKEFYFYTLTVHSLLMRLNLRLLIISIFFFFRILTVT